MEEEEEEEGERVVGSDQERRLTVDERPRPLSLPPPHHIQKIYRDGRGREGGSRIEV